MYKERDEKTGMTVPKGFFDEMERKINAQIDAEIQTKTTIKPAEPQPTVTPMIGRRSMAWRVAAIVTLVLGVGLLYMGMTGSLALGEDEEKLAKVRGAAAVGTDLAETEVAEDAEVFELPEQVEESMVASISDYEMYCLMCEGE